MSDGKREARRVSTCLPRPIMRRAERHPSLGPSDAAKLAARTPHKQLQLTLLLYPGQLGKLPHGAAGAGARIRSGTGLGPHTCGMCASASSATPATLIRRRYPGRAKTRMTRHRTNVPNRALTVPPSGGIPVTGFARVVPESRGIFEMATARAVPARPATRLDSMGAPRYE